MVFGEVDDDRLGVLLLTVDDRNVLGARRRFVGTACGAVDDDAAKKGQ